MSRLFKIGSYWLPWIGYDNLRLIYISYYVKNIRYLVRALCNLQSLRWWMESPISSSSLKSHGSDSYSEAIFIYITIFYLGTCCSEQEFQVYSDSFMWYLNGNDFSFSDAYRPCGLREIFTQLDSKIIGGNAAKKGSWPWMAAIFYSPKNEHIWCGGVLFNHEWLLTAAHCFDKSQDVTKYTVILGTF